MAKNTFVLKTDLDKRTKKLTDDELGKLMRKIFKYVKGEEVPILSEKLEVVFDFIQEDIDENQKRYENTCKKRKEAVEKRWGMVEEKNTNEYKSIQMYKNDYDSDTHNHIHNHVENKKDNRGMGEEEKEETFGDTVKASKHKYGQFKNVLLKDEELQALKEKYSNYEELIDFLSEYIERKGYKAKSHYLCIKKWVVDAVKNEKLKNVKQASVPEWIDKNPEIKEPTEEIKREMEELINAISK